MDEIRSIEEGSNEMGQSDDFRATLIREIPTATPILNLKYFVKSISHLALDPHCSLDDVRLRCMHVCC